jgi:raffinose/stachyose/melibiose transport system substrate-binding protein
MMVFGFAAITHAEDWTQEPITLTMWHNSDRVEYVEMVQRYYSELYPNVTFEHSFYTSAEIKTNTPIAAASGTLPSVFLKSNGATCKSLSENGHLKDLTYIAERDNWDDTYYAWVLDQIRLEGNGQMTQLPFFYQVFDFLYRTDIMEELGFVPPTTMAELETYFEACRAAGYDPITLGGSSGTHILRLWSTLLETFAGSDQLDQLFALEDDWRCEAVEETFACLKSWVDKGYFPEGFMTYGPNDARILLYTRQAAMTFDSAAIFQNIRKDFGTVEEYDFFQLPRDGGGTRLMAEMQGYMLNANLTDAETEAAIAWLYLWDSQDIEEIHDKAILFSVIENGVLQDWAAKAVTSIDEIIAENGTTANYDIVLPEIIYNTLMDVNEQVILGTLTPAEAAAAVQVAIDQYKAG